MAPARKRTGSKAARKRARPARRASGKPRPGLPAPESVVAVHTMTSPKGARYRIIETDETDAYDPPLKPSKKRR